MILVVSQFVFFAALIVGVGSFLSHYADEIAEITGFGRMLIGSVMLASATSLSGLSVDIACVRQGNPDLAVGDLLGSSPMNLLILAVLDLTHRSRGKMFSRAASGRALGGAASIALTAIVAVSLLVERQTGGRELIGLGMGSIMVMRAYVLSVRMIFLDQRIAAWTSAEDSARTEKAGNVLNWPNPVFERDEM